MTDDIDALIAQLRGISLYSFQGDLDPDERRRELTNIYEAVQVGLLLASRVRAALVEARERVAEWERDYRAVITEDCDSRATAEQHCTCVPHLRRRIAELEAQRDEVVASLNFLTTGQYSQHADYTNHKLQAALTALSHLYEACYAADVTDEPERITGEVLDEAKRVLGLLVEEE